MQRETVWLVEDEQGIADTLVYMLQYQSAWEQRLNMHGSLSLTHC